MTSHLKMDGWQMILSSLGRLGLFSGAFAVSLRGGNSPHFGIINSGDSSCRFGLGIDPFYNLVAGWFRKQL